MRLLCSGKIRDCNINTTDLAQIILLWGMRSLDRVKCSALFENASKNTRKYCPLAEVRVVCKRKTVLDTDLSVCTDEVRQPSND